MSKSFQYLATVSASTKRIESVTDGKRGEISEHLTGLKVLPLDPFTADIQIRPELNTPHRLLQTEIEDGPDIKEGDLLVVDSVEYPIKVVEKWFWHPSETDTLLLVLEDLRI